MQSRLSLGWLRGSAGTVYQHKQRLAMRVLEFMG
jgi:hypothetical protein